MAKRFVLVACVKTKAKEARPARKLYISSWFQKAVLYAERYGDEWYILSAQYGVVHPDTVIAPYKKHLLQLSASERRKWATGVISALEAMLQAGCEVVILAGVPYREYLVRPIEQMGCRVTVPMAGLTQGRQLQWLNAQLE